MKGNYLLGSGVTILNNIMKVMPQKTKTTESLFFIFKDWVKDLLNCMHEGIFPYNSAYTINKLKYFKPTLKEGFFSNTIYWEERKTPLTDGDLETRCGVKNI
jgi:hypothetical protein